MDTNEQDSSNHGKQLRKNATPLLSTGRDTFQSQLEDGKYWGIPRRFFTIEGSSVTLDSKLATKINWTIDSDATKNAINIAAITGMVTVDGEELYIPPGFWCSYVPASDIKNYTYD